MSHETSSVKLQNPFVPKSYDLHFTVDLSQWRYEAKETIVFSRASGVAAASEVRLHYAPSMTIRGVTGATVAGEDAKSGTLLLRLDGNPAEGHSVTFDFAHTIEEEMRGFYRAHFHTSDGASHRMAATHFEPTAARRFYICHDEPAARADFTLRVTLPASAEGFTVLSNGPLLSTSTADGAVTHHFAMVPAVPPYLTCCFVGELESVSGSTASGIPVKVYTAIGKAAKAAFALKTTIFALEYFEKFFACPYPLPKLDVVAVPDFPIGGMENWGCIACVESILVVENVSSVAALKRAAELLCHEVSHNWFGNLVAINWWEGLWLKEGFASWCGYSAAQQMQPSWHADEDAAADVAEALISDMYEHSHPVEVPIRDPAEITQIFDAISYDKGMGLVFMLEAFLGDSKWATAVAHYIAKYRYSDTRTIQLWEALEESSGFPLTEAMESFTTQMGYPMVHVSRPTPSKVVLRQVPCQFASAQVKHTSLWCVPIVLEGQNGASLRVTLRGAEPHEVELSPELAASPWINANPRRQGFFRCRYDDDAFHALVHEYPKLAVADRCSLISDTLASIDMGNDDIERLSIFRSLLCQFEESKAVWRVYFVTVESFVSFIEDDNLHRELRFGLLYQVQHLAVKQLDKTPSTTEEREWSSFLINAGLKNLLKCSPAPEINESPLLQWALREATSFFASKSYSPDTLSMSLATYAQLGEGEAAARGETLWKRFTEVQDSDETSRALLSGICWLPHPEFVENTFKRCIYGDGIRSQYGGTMFAAGSQNSSLPKGFIWSLFTRHFEGIEKQWGKGTFRIQTIVAFVGSTLSGEAQAASFLEFFHTHPLPHAHLAIQRAAEGIRLRAWQQAKWGIGRQLSHRFFPK